MGVRKKQVLVVGGGVAGMAAARALNQYGLKVHLVEKDMHLGGHAVKWACMATDQCRNCGACLSVELVEQIEHAAQIKVHLDTRIETIQAIGEGYRATLYSNTPMELTVDGIILATGMRLFDAARIESLQYGRHSRVITTADLNRLLQTDTLTDLIGRVSDPAIAFVQCVGSRNKSLGNDYCSQVCCKVALRQAGKLRQVIPGAQLSIFHIDLQLIGKEIRSQAKALMNDVSLLQGVPGEIRIDRESGRLMIVREAPSTGRRQAHLFDLVVLAVGMRPADQLQTLFEPLGVPFDNWGFISSETPLPARLQVAGAGKFPTDITGAMRQGADAAHRVASQLKVPAAIKGKGAVAVFGNGWEGHRVALALQAAGYDTLLLDAQPASEKALEPYKAVFSARITSLGGTAGHYTLRYTCEGQAAQHQVMALVVANGTVRRASAPATEVMSLSDMEKILVADWEQIPRRVVFWLDLHGPEHKTSFRRALQSAIDLTASGRQVSMIMERVLVHDPGGQQQYDRARRQGVRFLRAADAAAVRIVAADKGWQITLQDTTLPDMPLTLDCDLVVAADQVLPGAHTEQIADLIREPLDCEGFAQEANVRLRPINSRKKGIFYLGSCHDENDADDLDHEIQNLICQLALMNQPGAGDEPTARIDEGRCGRCLTCLRTCPHAAVAIVHENQPQIQSEACVGCGRCVSQCPARAISLSQDLPETGAQARTVVYACRRSGHLAAERALADGLVRADESISLVRVNCCRSRIGIQELLSPLLAGARHVLVAACHQGNCQSVDTGRTPDEHLQGTAHNIGLTAEEMSWHAVAANEPVRLGRILASIASRK